MGDLGGAGRQTVEGERIYGRNMVEVTEMPFPFPWHAVEVPAARCPVHGLSSQQRPAGQQRLQALCSVGPCCCPATRCALGVFFLPRDGAVGSCFDAGDMTAEEERDGGEECQHHLGLCPGIIESRPCLTRLNLRNTTTKQRQRQDPEPQTRNTNAPDAYTKLIASCPSPHDLQDKLTEAVSTRQSDGR